mmetsp:Transcript_23162/g.59344  ORF Transcript_23162/g.59344 Transcript_23162/m.59344 type:complete len:1051 (-) Transcript_23162:502-3654(-)
MADLNRKATWRSPDFNATESDVESANGRSWGLITAEGLEAVCKERDLEALTNLGCLDIPLATNASDGIDLSTLEERRGVFGANIHQRAPGTTYLQLVWQQLKDPMLILLMAAATVSTVLGAALPEEREEAAYIDGIAIWCAVLVVVGVGAGNDYHKELQFRKLNAAKDILQTKVVRGGQHAVVVSTDLVVGDIIILETGDKIPADGVIVPPFRKLSIDESALTGESDAVSKSAVEPFIISGSQVVEGEGRMMVLAVGPRTEWGRLLALTTGEAEATPLQEKLTGVAAMVAKVGLSVAVACFVVLFIFLCVEIKGFPTTGPQWYEVLDMFLYAVTIVVVAVPEGLPLAVTISLAYSMRKMMKDNNFVRHLAACETMGGATCICTDKTGTLTENCMTVVEGWLGGQHLPRAPVREDLSSQVYSFLSNGIATNSSAFLVEEGAETELVGNRTECALLLMARAWGADYQQLREDADVAAVATFSSDRKRGSVLLRESGSHAGAAASPAYTLHVKGAAEIILARCKGTLTDAGQHAELTPALRTELEELITSMASRGLRTLAVASRDVDEDIGTACLGTGDIAQLEEGLTLVAVLGIKDPVRAGVPDTVNVCKAAGIAVKMVTGDNLYTAQHIARECNLLHDDGIVMDGPTFRGMSDEQLLPMLPQLQVLARSQPADKHRLVSLLRRQGEVVAVTGDGTNDAPALKEADVGLAMGICGTDVAKEASDIVILDDNFGSIVKAVEWGRCIFGNIRKFLQFQLTVNLVALTVAFVAAVTGRGTPLTVLQLLWVNLIMDSLAALALATENPTPDLLQEMPHGRHEALLTPHMKYHMLVQMLYQLAWLFFFLYGLPTMGISPAYAPTCTVACEQWTAGSACAIEPEPEGSLCLEALPFDVEHHNEQMHAQQQLAVHSLLFNSFIFMQLFNEINSRKLGDQLNIFEGIWRNPVFLGVIATTLGCQIIIMQTPVARAFHVQSQTWQEWLTSIAIGAGSTIVCLLSKLLLRLVVRAGCCTACFGRRSRAPARSAAPGCSTADGHEPKFAGNPDGSMKLTVLVR